MTRLMKCLKKLSLASSLVLVACACDGNEVRPYKHYLLRLDLQKGVQIENPEPINDVKLEDMDGWVCQSEEGFRLKELERASLIERLKACEKSEE